MSEDTFEATPETFESILEAVRETPRGRWFLDEFAKRNRVSDTEQVLLGLERLRSAFSSNTSGDNRVEILRLELQQMSASIQETRREIASIKPKGNSDSRIMAATEELDAIVTATERATTEILTSAERLQEIVDRLRDRELDEDACDELEDLATQIFMACSFQDITGQRTTKVVNTLRYLEQRVNSMIQIWGIADVSPVTSEDEAKDSRPDAHLLNGPSREGEGVSQDEIDKMLNSETAAENAEEEQLEELSSFAVMEEGDESVPEVAVETDDTEGEEVEAKDSISQDDVDALFG